MEILSPYLQVAAISRLSVLSNLYDVETAAGMSTKDFAKSLYENLSSMTLGQRRLACLALRYIRFWFGGNYMGEGYGEKVSLVQAKKGNDVSLNTLANTMNWMNQILGLNSTFPKVVYRLQTVAFEKGFRPKSKTSEGYYQAGLTLIRSNGFGKPMLLSTHRPLLSCAADLKGIKTFTRSAIDVELEDSAYALFKIKISDVTPLMSNLNLKPKITLLRGVRSTGIFQRDQNGSPKLSYDDKAIAVLDEMINALKGAYLFRKQREVVCLAEKPKFVATPIAYYGRMGDKILTK